MSFWSFAEGLINWDPLGIYRAYSGTPPEEPVIPPGSTEQHVATITDWGKIVALGGLMGLVGLGIATYTVARIHRLASD